MGKYPVRKYEGLEIDREALAKELSTNGMITHASLRKADAIISTMPTWLKRIEK